MEQGEFERAMKHFKSAIRLYNLVSQAEDTFEEAIKIAQRQKAKSWELRAVISLAKLLREQGRRDEARERLQRTYSWFKEGFDTGDLIQAKQLLIDLSSTQAFGGRH
jgi:predicted ATPase